MGFLILCHVRFYSSPRSVRIPGGVAQIEIEVGVNKWGIKALAVEHGGQHCVDVRCTGAPGLTGNIPPLCC